MPIRVLLGYDGSPAASAAIDVGARLFPWARAWVVHLWTPQFASTGLQQRLWTDASHLNDFVAAIEREGEREAERIAAMGVTLAAAAGWDAEPLVVRSFGGEGLQLAELAEKNDADLVLVGSRGLGGARAVLGSVSDMVVHYTTRPVLVVPYPLLSAEYDCLANGPVLVGVDGSTGAHTAADSAARLFPGRSLMPVAVDDGQAVADTAGSQPVSYADVTRLPGGHGVHGQVVADALSRYARGRGAAAIVVGSRGRSAVAEILLGSVAMATLHHAHRPVLVAPEANRTLS